MIITKVRQNFAYDLSCEMFHSHWLPVKQPEIVGYNGEYLYIENELFDKHKDEIIKVFFGSGSVHQIGKITVAELSFDERSCMEKYYNSDMFFVSQNIKRVIYFFHEGTVTFAGKHFLHKVKIILDKERHLFNRAWWQDLPHNKK